MEYVHDDNPLVITPLTIGATNNNAPLIIGAVGMDAIMQNIRMILSATQYSVPLDRGFAHVADAIDTPSPRITALYIANLIETIEANEPRVKVISITLKAIEGMESVQSFMEGRLSPVVKFRLKEGVIL